MEEKPMLVRSPWKNLETVSEQDFFFSHLTETIHMTGGLQSPTGSANAKDTQSKKDTQFPEGVTYIVTKESEITLFR